MDKYKLLFIKKSAENLFLIENNWWSIRTRGDLSILIAYSDSANKYWWKNDDCIAKHFFNYKAIEPCNLSTYAPIVCVKHKQTKEEKTASFLPFITTLYLSLRIIALRWWIFIHNVWSLMYIWCIHCKPTYVPASTFERVHTYTYTQTLPAIRYALCFSLWFICTRSQLIL